jgi:Protein of unknown function (DUF3667)
MSTATATQSTSLEHSASPAAASWAAQCLNCGSTLTGPFCAECGQRAVPPHPTLRELFGEALAEFSGWDGKLAETIRTLLRKPGQLTVEFLAGRRAHFISPLRLYFMSSLVFFLVSAAAPRITFIGTRPAPGPIAVQKDNGPKQDASTLTAEERAEILQQLNTAPTYIRPLLRQALENPKQLQANVIEAMPKALFGLLPVFALILSAFYRRRRFADHLYFAIHLHAFIFIALMVTDLVKFTHSVPLSLGASIVALLWVPIYAHLSLRRVYGGSRGATLLKELGIGALYGAASVPAMVAAVAWAASRG